ncbi:MAG: hypothetical protein QOF52_313 [Propionibacteriaceae bacterium]|nr:hypothetical protein [Propionibacteriaceae bacterium]
MIRSAGDNHPRPDHRRDTPWWSLDGVWELLPDKGFTVDTLPTGQGCPILVPYAWETAASGVQQHWLERAWYRRTIDAPDLSEGDRLVLHFGAVHHAAQVFVDGALVSTHVGGQTPFEVDITDTVGTAGRITLVVRVDAPIDKGELPHGKQRSVPADPYDVCSFTPCSGIWQSVWLEQRPATYLRTVGLIPLPDLTGFRVRAVVDGPAGGDVRAHARILGSGEATECDLSGLGLLSIEGPRLWSPRDPHLYEVEVELRRSGVLIDRLLCVGGLRTVSTSGAHLLLNGERVYLRGVLDQGYWPESGWTAPSEQALLADLQAARNAGFTMVRKHLKLEDPRWLHHADRIGMLVWEEPASTSRFSAASVAAFESQIPAMVERDLNHPSIIIWGLYNEEWGLDWDVANDPAKQQAIRDAYDLTKSLDDTRPVIDNSGWSHVRTDLTDWHVYSPDHRVWTGELEDLASGGQRGFVVDLGRGGLVRKYVNADASSFHGTPSLNSEYGTGSTSAERAWTMRWQTQEMRRSNELNGYVYTELYDIEHETVGVLTDHRAAKDTLGLVPADCHSDTVIIVDLAPFAPGCDLITDAAGELMLTLRLSHHGQTAIAAEVRGGWTKPLSSTLPAQADQTAAMTAKPFVLSEPIRWSDRLPDGLEHARLHLWILGPTGDQLARTVLDVCRGSSAAVAGRADDSLSI